LSAEIKGGAEFDFPNTIKLFLAGNHRPNFISGEAGGLLRRNAAPRGHEQADR
jgi:phage/plasmid-associated DNA primase